jgi:hypothetical protein
VAALQIVESARITQKKSPTVLAEVWTLVRYALGKNRTNVPEIGVHFSCQSSSSLSLIRSPEESLILLSLAVAELAPASHSFLSSFRS